MLGKCTPPAAKPAALKPRRIAALSDTADGGLSRSRPATWPSEKAMAVWRWFVMVVATGVKMMLAVQMDDRDSIAHAGSHGVEGGNAAMQKLMVGAG